MLGPYLEQVRGVRAMGSPGQRRPSRRATPSRRARPADEPARRAPFGAPRQPWWGDKSAQEWWFDEFPRDRPADEPPQPGSPGDPGRRGAATRQRWPGAATGQRWLDAATRHPWYTAFGAGAGFLVLVLGVIFIVPRQSSSSAAMTDCRPVPCGAPAVIEPTAGAAPGRSFGPSFGRLWPDPRQAGFGRAPASPGHGHLRGHRAVARCVAGRVHRRQQRHRQHHRMGIVSRVRRGRDPGHGGSRRAGLRRRHHRDGSAARLAGHPAGRQRVRLLHRRGKHAHTVGLHLQRVRVL